MKNIIINEFGKENTSTIQDFVISKLEDHLITDQLLAMSYEIESLREAIGHLCQILADNGIIEDINDIHYIATGFRLDKSDIRVKYPK